MAVRPIRLQRVVADRLDRMQHERVRRVALRQASGHASEQIGLAAADRAGAVATKLFERIVLFVAVVPHDDEQITDYLI